jgi:hypothetical protein
MARFRAGVSLHSHTMRSKEKLSSALDRAGKLPIIGRFLARHQRRYREQYNRDLDFSRAYWTPPAPEHEALQIERAQIERGLDLSAMVSLTDHDTIEAPLHLRVLDEEKELPISLEWSVPFCGITLHLGVHNLPPEAAPQWVNALRGYTREPSAECLADLLGALDHDPGTLIVLNHPGWCEEGGGAALQTNAVQQFLAGYGHWVHAIELNGMRPWSENKIAIGLGRAFNLPVISGGDRHGCEPTAVLNLTNTSSFAEFVSEVRHDKISDVLVMPHYRESFRVRYLEAMWDVLRDHPEYAGRVHWSDRFFYIDDAKRHTPLSAIWKEGEPLIVRCFLASMNLCGNSRVRSTLRQTFSGNEVSL